MNILEYYSRQKIPWDDNELKQIKNEYENEKMSVIEIADIHRRTPGCISFQLKKIGLINKHTDSRGYDKYRASRLYQEIVCKNKKNELDKKRKLDINEQPRKIITSIKNKYEIDELKKDIISLKNDVKEILRLMNAVYDFESQ